MSAIAINSQPRLRLDEAAFAAHCQAHPEQKFERTAQGELIVVALTGGETGRRNFRLSVAFGIWHSQTQLGEAFDSSTGFRLPNGAIRSPDLAWVAAERWAALSSAQRKAFVPLCPDFVVELKSPSDRLEDVREKMREYLANGARLGWLLNPETQSAEIYRPDRSPELLTAPVGLSGEDVLPGLRLSMVGILE